MGEAMFLQGVVPPRAFVQHAAAQISPGPGSADGERQGGSDCAGCGELPAQVLTRCGPNMAYRLSLAVPAEMDAYAAFERIR